MVLFTRVPIWVPIFDPQPYIMLFFLWSKNAHFMCVRARCSAARLGAFSCTRTGRRAVLTPRIFAVRALPSVSPCQSDMIGGKDPSEGSGVFGVCKYSPFGTFKNSRPRPAQFAFEVGAPDSSRDYAKKEHLVAHAESGQVVHHGVERRGVGAVHFLNLL